MAKENGCENCTNVEAATVAALVERRKKLHVRVEDIAPLMGLSPAQVWRLEDQTRRMKVRQAKQYESAMKRLAA